MTFIKNTNVYQYQEPVSPEDYVIGTEASTGNAKNFKVSDIAALASGGEDLPENFFVSCVRSGAEGSRILYITDEIRYFTIENLAPSVVSNAASVEIHGNNIFILYYVVSPTTPTEQPFGVMALYNCKIVNNILVPGSTDYVVLEGIIYEGVSSPRLHCEGYHDGFLYYATRTFETIQTQLVKVNAYNLRDYKIVELGEGITLTNIEIVKNYIYYIPMSEAVGPSTVSRIDNNFMQVEEVFTIGETLEKSIREQIPFLIYNGEIYIFTYRGSNSDPLRHKRIGLQVFGMNGNLKRETELELAPDATSGRIVPHWFTAFNGKLIFHTAVSLSNTQLVVRVDAETLEVEESITAPAGLTDDNTVLRDGSVWLNNEESGLFTFYLYKIDNYLDFSTLHTVGEPGYFSAGSTPTHVPKDVLITLTSELINKGEDGSSPYATKSYVDAVGAQTLTNANNYTDAAIAGISAGARVPKVVPDTTYTMVEEDKGKFLQFTAATAVTVTVPTGLSADNRYEGIQLGAGQVSFVEDSTTVNTHADEVAATAGQFSVFGLDWVDVETYVLYGKLDLV